MIDARMRSDERLVLSGDEDARQRLTLDRIRGKTGLLAWWPGLRQPHPKAVRVSVRWVGNRRVSGWVVAISSLEDLLRVSYERRGAGLLDLDTGGWVQLRSELPSMPALLPRDDTMFYPFGSTPTPDGGERFFDRSSVDYPVGLPAPAVMENPSGPGEWQDRSVNSDPVTMQAIPREQGPYDTVWVRPDDKQVAAFQNYRSFDDWARDPDSPADAPRWITVSRGAPREKIPDVDTNMSGATGSLPPGYSLEWTGVSVDLLDEKDVPLRGEVWDAVVASFGIKYLATRNPLWTLPLSAVARRPEDGPDGLPALDFFGPPVQTFAIPMLISPVEQLSFCIYRNVSARPGIPGFFCRIIMSGVLRRATGA